MANPENNNVVNKAVLDQIKKLEERVSHLEKLVDPNSASLSTENIEDLESGLRSLKIGIKKADRRSGNEGLESSIGEYGLAFLGSFVMFFGITFLARYLQNKGFPLMGSLTGYLAAGTLFILAHYLRKSFVSLSFMLKLTGYIIIYYITLHLHFFTSEPIVFNKYLIVFLLLFIPGIQLVFSLRQNSEFSAAMAFIIILLTALFTNEKHLSLTFTALASATSVYLYMRKGWFRFLLFALFATYLTHFLWLINNPVSGQSVHLTDPSQYNLVYLFAPGLFYSLALLVKHKVKMSINALNALVIVNGMFFSFVLLLAVFAFHKESYTTIFILIFLICFAYSILLRIKTTYKFPAAFYVCYGFFSLSVAVYGYAGLPDSFFLLSIQSLLVVSMALWYRSRFIVMLNIFLYAGLLIAYLVIADPDNKINVAFALVALITARILNWKKERLTLKTEMLRNVYLFSAFVMILVSLYHAVPDKYITVSWSLVAVFFFTASVLLKNIKYRWVALAVLLTTVTYLFLVDLAHLEVGIRVIAFLVFGAISLGASLFYTKKIKGKGAEADGADTNEAP